MSPWPGWTASWTPFQAPKASSPHSCGHNSRPFLHSLAREDSPMNTLLFCYVIFKHYIIWSTLSNPMFSSIRICFKVSLDVSGSSWTALPYGIPSRAVTVPRRRSPVHQRQPLPGPRTRHEHLHGVWSAETRDFTLQGSLVSPHWWDSFTCPCQVWTRTLAAPRPHGHLTLSSLTLLPSEAGGTWSIMSARPSSTPTQAGPCLVVQGSCTLAPLWTALLHMDKYLLHLAYLFTFFTTYFSFFLLCHKAGGILVPWPGIKPAPCAMKVGCPNHWTTRKVPFMASLK